VDGAFYPTMDVILDTSSRPFGYQFTTVDIPAGVTVKLEGKNPAIFRCQGDMNIAGVILADGGHGTKVTELGEFGQSGGKGGPGSHEGGAGFPVNTSAIPWRSYSAGGPCGGQGGEWSRQTWSTSAWPWAGTDGTDIPGSGGGGGNAQAGGGGAGSNLPGADGTGGTTNTAGDPSLAGFILSDAGGSGGGGGGGADHSAAGIDGAGTLAHPPDDGGAGGGGGGGVVNLLCAETLSITGKISARGGFGGSNVGSATSHTSGGVGGGAGAGGCILLQGKSVDVTGGFFDARGGSGGTGGYLGGFWGLPQYVSQGGAGGSGWIRFESISGAIIGEYNSYRNPSWAPAYSKGVLNLQSTQGQSFFFDTGVEDPDYVENALSGFSVNGTVNGGTIQVFAQGADADANGQPDEQTCWPNNASNTNPGWALIYDSTSAGVPYTGAINQVDRYRFIRFKVVFGNIMNAFPPGPYVTDLTFPFRD
jgi:hypothetical protein